MAIPEIAIRDGIKRSDAVTCRHLRHFGDFRGAGFGLAPTGLGLAPTGRRLPEGSGGQGTRIPTPPLEALSLNLTTVSRASQGVSAAKTKILRTSRRRTRYGRVCARGVLTDARFSEQPKKKNFVGAHVRPCPLTRARKLHTRNRICKNGCWSIRRLQHGARRARRYSHTLQSMGACTTLPRCCSMPRFSKTWAWRR